MDCSVYSAGLSSKFLNLYSYRTSYDSLFCFDTSSAAFFFISARFFSRSAGNFTRSVLMCFGKRPFSFSCLISSTIDLSVNANTISCGFSLREPAQKASARILVSLPVPGSSLVVLFEPVEIKQTILPSSETASHSNSPPDCTPNLRFAKAW